VCVIKGKSLMGLAAIGLGDISTDVHLVDVA
jgi:hypothetical protein